LRNLLLTKFMDDRTGQLLEYFTTHWRRWPDPDGSIVEPGHHAEWTWLLRLHDRLTGRPADPLARALLDRAVATADRETGFLCDEIDLAGKVRRATRRCWPQTELAKGWIAEHEIDRPEAAAKAGWILQAIHRHYLSGSVPSTWIDKLDSSGRPASEFIPASTLYHLFVAIAEAHRVASGEPAR